MKKLLHILFATALVLAGTTPAKAIDSEEREPLGGFSRWLEYRFSSSMTISASGSQIEGHLYTVTGSGSCPSTLKVIVDSESITARSIYRSYATLTYAKESSILGREEKVQLDGQEDPGFQISSTIAAGPAGTREYYIVFAYCMYVDSKNSYYSTKIRSSLFRVVSYPVGSPLNFILLLNK